MNFSNKAVTLINLIALFDNSELKSLLKDVPCNFVSPTLVYNLTHSISSYIFNFKKFLSNVNIGKFLIDPYSVPCHCEDSPFKDQDHGHILTGNLKTVSDNKLRKIFSKGPRYRELKNLTLTKLG